MLLSRVKNIVEEKLADENFPRPCNITKRTENGIVRCDSGAVYEIKGQVVVQDIFEGKRISNTEIQDLCICEKHLKILRSHQVK
jgi:hypothetical protein